MNEQHRWWLTLGESIIDHLEVKQRAASERKRNSTDSAFQSKNYESQNFSAMDTSAHTPSPEKTPSTAREQPQQSLPMPLADPPSAATRSQPCPKCEGTGRVVCQGCGGRGYNLVQSSRMGWNNSIQYYTTQQICAVCTGSKGRMRCPQCNGKGM